MSSVDNGEEEDADTPSKPGSTRLSFIKDPSRIEASSLEEDFSTRRRTENSPCPTSMWFLSSGDCLLRATLKKKEEKKERRKKKEPRAAGRTGWLALARNSTCQEYLKNWISLSHPRAG